MPLNHRSQLTLLVEGSEVKIKEEFKAHYLVLNAEGNRLQLYRSTPSTDVRGI